jgi:glycosyltransferase involved in cell wall biosynthesis
MQSREIIYVLIPTYNHKNYIQDAVFGALSQSVDAALKIVIRDDASTDGTQETVKELAEKFPGKIVLIQNKRNQFDRSPGPIGAMLRNVKKMEKRAYLKNLLSFKIGKREAFVAICEGDDYWIDPNKLQVQISILRNNKLASLVHHAVNIQTEDLASTTYEKQLKDHIMRFDAGAIFAPGTYFRFGHNVFMCSAFFRLRGSNLRPFLKKPAGIIGDWVLFALLAQRTPPIYLDIPMSTYRIHRDSVWSSKSNEEREPAEARTLEYLEKIFVERLKRNKHPTYTKPDQANRDVNSND